MRQILLIYLFHLLKFVTRKRCADMIKNDEDYLVKITFKKNVEKIWTNNTNVK